MADKKKKESTESLNKRIQELEAALAQSENEKLALQKELEKKQKAGVLHETTDRLTDLFNRRTIFDKLEEEMDRAERFDNPLTILLLDIDNFNQINEDYGREYGDEVLVTLSKVLKKATRNFDLIGRYGGEEFLVIFPETDLKAAYGVADRIRQTVESTLFGYGTHVTVSGGLKAYYTEDMMQLMREADMALDQAKEEGKNLILKSAK